MFVTIAIQMVDISVLLSGGVGLCILYETYILVSSVNTEPEDQRSSNAHLIPKPELI